MKYFSQFYRLELHLYKYLYVQYKYTYIPQLRTGTVLMQYEHILSTTDLSKCTYSTVLSTE